MVASRWREGAVAWRGGSPKRSVCTGSPSAPDRLIAPRALAFAQIRCGHGELARIVGPPAPSLSLGGAAPAQADCSGTTEARYHVRAEADRTGRRGPVGALGAPAGRRPARRRPRLPAAREALRRHRQPLRLARCAPDGKAGADAMRAGAPALRFERVLGAQLQRHRSHEQSGACCPCWRSASSPKRGARRATSPCMFADGAAIRLQVECIEAELKDLGPVWQAKVQAAAPGRGSRQSLECHDREPAEASPCPSD